MTTLYHGTRRGFTKGGVVIPRATHGGEGNGAPFTPGSGVYAGDETDAYVYVTPDLDLARAFAESAVGRGRAKVLEVEPMAEVEVDPATIGGDDAPLYRIRGWARVVRVVEVAR